MQIEMMRPSELKQVKVHNPNNLPIIDYKELTNLQNDLKQITQENLDKLVNSIKINGIFLPKFLYINEGKHYIMDGHQTIKALIQLEAEGYEIPSIPYVEIKAKNKKEAGEKLLQINSRYGTINPDTSFFADFNIDLSFTNEIEIPELNIDNFNPENKEQEISKLETQNKCPSCGYEW